MTTIIYDSIWGFREDILELRKSFKERVWKAHLSQPLGIPLHRYRGQLTVETERLSLSGKDEETGRTADIDIPRDKIVETYLGWDDVMRRWRDTRAWIRPLRLTFREDEASQTPYIYAKNQGAMVFGTENNRLYEMLSQRLG